MSNRLLEQLETKIDDIIETMDSMRAEIEVLEAKNEMLQNENTSLKNRQSHWEQGLSTLIHKLDDATLQGGKGESSEVKHFVQEEMEELV